MLVLAVSRNLAERQGSLASKVGDFSKKNYEHVFERHLCQMITGLILYTVCFDSFVESVRKPRKPGSKDDKNLMTWSSNSINAEL